MQSVEFEPGDKIQYSQDGKIWLKGVIHGVRKVDTEKNGSYVLSYLVDTGKVASYSERTYSLRELFINDQSQKHIQKGMLAHEAQEKVIAETKNLPSGKMITEKFNHQPEQIEIKPELVKEI